MDLFDIKLNQAKLDSEINARFLLNEHGNLYFLLLNNSVHVILFNLKIFLKKYRKEKRYRWKRAQNRYSVIQIMTATIRTPYIQVVLNCVILFMWYCFIDAWHFLPVKLFLKYYFNKLCFELPQNVTWIDRQPALISTSTGINGLRLSYQNS